MPNNISTEDEYLDTDFAEKARKLMQRAVRTTALVIMPLAAAVNAHAGVIGSGGPVLPDGSPGCSISDTPGSTGGSCTGGAYNVAALGPTGITGVSLYNTGTPQFSGGGTAQMILTATGALTGAGLPNNTTIPLGYFFDLQFQNGGLGATVTSWTLDFQLLDGSRVIGVAVLSTAPASITLINEGGQFFDGTSSLTTTSSAALNDTLRERVTLDVDWSVGGGDVLTIQVPAPATFDYDPTNSTSSVPEPATIIPMASSLALAGFYLFRRKTIGFRGCPRWAGTLCK
jgi:hypothetical protein